MNDDFESWLNEIEVFSARWERLHSDFPTLTPAERVRLDEWLRAAYRVGLDHSSKNG